MAGNAVACAAALATLDVIQEEGLVENARVRGSELMDSYGRLRQTTPVIGEVRDLGLMIGNESQAVTSAAYLSFSLRPIRTPVFAVLLQNDHRDSGRANNGTGESQCGSG
jgi:acetylornithine/succinyldiaminopimelate/putrescine aminotransferase